MSIAYFLIVWSARTARAHLHNRTINRHRQNALSTFKVFMDAKSMIYLKGMQLVFHGGLQGKGFVFVNPNATSTCGCGESFSLA